MDFSRLKEDKLTPLNIVRALDRYIIGQYNAKRAVAIAIRNRWRRIRVKGDIKREISPNNILMIGPTGVGKTEIARRIAHLSSAPFVKVEASRFTEVGYVGKDVEYMIRALIEVGVNMVKEEFKERIRGKARKRALKRLVKYLLSKFKPPQEKVKEEESRIQSKLLSGELDEEEIEIKPETPQSRAVPIGMEFIANTSPEEMMFDLQDMLNRTLNPGKKTRRLKVKEAMGLLTDEEMEKLINMDDVVAEAKYRTEEKGIIFIDEIDKIASSRTHGPDVSREGVQRDLLPIIEGTQVVTKYGLIKTDHILFIGAGAFHMSRPSDLIPELQGRFPIRVELDPLKAEDFERILVEPDNAIVKQIQELFKVEGVKVVFTEDAIKKIADIAYKVNEEKENIGARRLQSVVNYLMEDYLFKVPDEIYDEINIDADFVDKRLSELIENKDLSDYIL